MQWGGQLGLQKNLAEAVDSTPIFVLQFRHTPCSCFLDKLAAIPPPPLDSSSALLRLGDDDFPCGNEVLVVPRAFLNCCCTLL